MPTGPAFRLAPTHWTVEQTGAADPQRLRSDYSQRMTSTGNCLEAWRAG